MPTKFSLSLPRAQSIMSSSETIRNSDKDALLPWLHWSHGLLALIMSSIKAWIKTGSDAQPGLRLLLDVNDVSRLTFLNELRNTHALNPSPEV